MPATQFGEMHLDRQPGISREALDLCKEIKTHFRAALDAELTCGEGVFLHGTTLYALTAALDTGTLPTGVQPDDGGYVYFNPLPSRFTYVPTDCFLPEDDEMAMELAESYSSLISLRVEAMRRFNLDLRDPAHYRAANGLSDPQSLYDYATCPVFRPLRDRGVTGKQAYELYDELNEGIWHRVLILFSLNLADDYKIEEAVRGKGRFQDEGLRLDIPGGIPFRYVAGIKPLTEKGSKELKKTLRS